MIVIGYVMVMIEAVIHGGGGGGCGGIVVVDVVPLSFRLEEHLSLRLQLYEKYEMKTQKGFNK